MVVEKINRLKNWQVALLIFIIGFVVFMMGLNSPFQGDDILQIVKNVPVHSISNLKLFFEGGNFYDGKGLAPLSGNYFRPLMTTSFSLIYSLFGPHPVYFHIFQLLLCMGSVFLFYLFFRFAFSVSISLFLSLILLVHPLDAEMVYSIPVTQDALYFFFGMLSMYLLLRFKSKRGLLAVVLCLLLALFAKETAIVFLVMALVYLFWWDRRRLLPFVGMMIIPLALYIVQRVHAIGLIPANPRSSPLDELSLSMRLMNAPSVILFYFTKFFFPWKLADGYFWAYKTFSLCHVLVPLFIDSAGIGLIIYEGWRIRFYASKAMDYTYRFFGLWLLLSLLILVHIIPLDATAAEPWFYASMVGVLGMCGVVLTVRRIVIKPMYLITAAVVILIVFGVRTALHGRDWQSDYKLQMSSIASSREDYVGYMDVALDLQEQGRLPQAEIYEKKSIALFPIEFNYTGLGVILTDEHEFPAALQAYQKSLQYGRAYLTYEDIGALTLFSDRASYASDKNYLTESLTLYPNDSTLWLYLALLEDRNGDNTDAQTAIVNAAKYGQIPEGLATSIMDEQSFSIQIVGSKVSI